MNQSRRATIFRIQSDPVRIQSKLDRIRSELLRVRSKVPVVDQTCRQSIPGLRELISWRGRVSPRHPEIIPYRIDIDLSRTRVSSSRIDVDPARRRPPSRWSRISVNRHQFNQQESQKKHAALNGVCVSFPSYVAGVAEKSKSIAGVVYEAVDRMG